ncbi:MAG: hypothetical protein HYX88_02165 [Chloroflexi bacterium]|nr:hypothetical protein [Chloroflexota bacterium]
MKVLNPIGEVSLIERALAARPESLAGRRVGLLDNGKANAGDFLARLGEALAQRDPTTQIIKVRKANFTRPASSSLIYEISQACDALINAFGD